MLWDLVMVAAASGDTQAQVPGGGARLMRRHQPTRGRPEARDRGGVSAILRAELVHRGRDIHLDGDGYPIQKRGVTEFPGLYFLGVPWLRNRKSGILFGAGDDASYLVSRILQSTRTLQPAMAS
jgi:hypothetical protein